MGFSKLEVSMSTTVNSFAVYAYSNHNSHLKYFVVNQPKKKC